MRKFQILLVLISIIFLFYFFVFDNFFENNKLKAIFFSIQTILLFTFLKKNEK